MSYATPEDVKTIGLPEAALQEVPDAVIQSHLDSEAGLIDSYLAARYSLPLVAPYPEALRRANVFLAVCSILLWRGYNPETFDTLYSERCKQTMAWLEAVAAGRANVPGVVDSTPGKSESAPAVVTATRLWGGGGCCGL
jgi:phage gp36-like protein